MTFEETVLTHPTVSPLFFWGEASKDWGRLANQFRELGQTEQYEYYTELADAAGWFYWVLPMSDVTGTGPIRTVAA